MVYTIISLFIYNNKYFTTIAHELVHSTPKSATTWYAIACYYWLCQKYEIAQKYLLKAVRINKR